MAMISDVITDHFSYRDDLQAIVMELDTGIYTVGLSVRMLRDMVLHGSPGSGSSRCDTEEVAASAQGLLAYIGYLGELIDQLEERTKPSARVRPQEAVQ